MHEAQSAAARPLWRGGCRHRHCNRSDAQATWPLHNAAADNRLTFESAQKEIESRMREDGETDMRSIVMWCSVFAVAPSSALECHAQDAASYPAKPIRLIIALAPGGGVDTSGRLLGQKFPEAWGQQVVAENRAGAGGTMATEQVARSAPDRHTPLMQSMSHAITPALYKLNYDTIKDFTPVSLFVQSPS